MSIDFVGDDTMRGPNDRVRLRTEVGTTSKTKQSFRDECDINKLMAKYLRTGDITHVSTKMPQYGDFSTVPDYKSALDQVNEAMELFMEMPADVRTRMENDPQKLIEFLDDPNNFEEGVELGLYEAPEESGAPETPEVPAAEPEGEPEATPPT